MKQEEKELLLKDLSARLPYGVKVLDDMGRTYELQIGNSYLIDLFYGNGDYVEIPVKPYLRPMSSMTEEEKIRLNSFMGKDSYGFPMDVINKEKVYEYLNWLLERHFDFNGLIPKGLAIEVTEENNPYKD